MNGTNGTVTVEAKELESTALALPDEATALVITDQVSYDRAAELERRAKDFIKRVEEYWEEPCGEAYTHWKGLVARRDALKARGLMVLNIVKPKRLGWEAEQRRVEQEKQAALDEAKRKQDEEDALAAAAAAEKSGAKPEEVEQILTGTLQQAQAVAPPVAARTFEPAKGVSRKNHCFIEISETNTELLEAIRYAAANPAYAGCLMWNPKGVRSMAESQKDFFKFPGVTATWGKV